jgi:type I restriction enzyme R subunit
LYDGKEYFTVYDFVKAHYNFADPEWDGDPDPIDPVACKYCGDSPCTCEDGEGGGSCKICEQKPCVCEKPEPEPCEDCGQQPCVCEKKILINLSDGRARQIKHIAGAIFIGPNGDMMTANEFLESLFQDLPQFFENEDQLREIWSDPTTREKLLADLSEAGYDNEKLDNMKDLIDAHDSDVYDVLVFVAYAAETRTRMERVKYAKPSIAKAFSNYKQREFIDFILDKYVEDGVQELAANKMRSLVELKYNTISDAATEFGSPAVIRDTFIGFQKHLYEA